MPTLTGPVTGDGALVSVIIGRSASAVRGLRQALRPIPAPVTGTGILDTGAEATCIDRAVGSALNLPFGKGQLVNVPADGGVGFAPSSDVSLTIVHPSGNARDNLVIPDLTVLEVPLASLGYDVLIGRDVLARCRLLYNGPGNRFRLRY